MRNCRTGFDLVRQSRSACYRRRAAGSGAGSGRIVTISNSEIFEQPAYNYTRDFHTSGRRCTSPFHSKDDRRRAEETILNAVRAHTQEIGNMAQPELERLKERFFIEAADIHPKVFLRITETEWNWRGGSSAPRTRCAR